MRHPKEMEALARRIEHDVGLLGECVDKYPDAAADTGLAYVCGRVNQWLPILKDLLNGDDSAVLRLTRKQLETL